MKPTARAVSVLVLLNLGICACSRTRVLDSFATKPVPAELETWREVVLHAIVHKSKASNEKLRQAVATLVAQIKRNPALELALMELLEETQQLLAKQAGIWVLGRASQGRAIPLLMRYLASDEPELASFAYEGLGMLTGQDFRDSTRSGFVADVEKARAWQREHPAFEKRCDGVRTSWGWQVCTPLAEEQSYAQLSCAQPLKATLVARDPRSAPCELTADQRRQLEQAMKEFAETNTAKQMGWHEALLKKVGRAVKRRALCVELLPFFERVVLDEKERDEMRALALEQLAQAGRPALRFALKTLRLAENKARGLVLAALAQHPEEDPALRELLGPALWQLKCASDPWVRSQAALGAGRFCKQHGVDEFLIAALHQEQDRLVQAKLAAQLLDAKSCPGLAYLAGERLLGTARGQARALVLDALWQADPARAFALQQRALIDPDEEARASAIYNLLDENGRQRSPGLLEQLLRQPPAGEEERIALGRAIADHHLLEGVPWLMGLLQGGSVKQKLYAVKALAQFPERAAEIRAALAPLRTSREEAVVNLQFFNLEDRELSIDVGSTVDFAFAELASREGDLREEQQRARAPEKVRDRACQRDCRCLYPAYQALARKEATVLFDGLERCPLYFLAACVSPAAAAPSTPASLLEEKLRSKSWYVQTCAAHLLAKQARPEARALLQTAYPTLAPEAKRYVLRASAADRSPAALRLLKQALEEQDRGVRAAALSWQLRVSPEAGLATLLQDYQRAQPIARHELATLFATCPDAGCVQAGLALQPKERDQLVRNQLTGALHEAARRLGIKLSLEGVLVPDNFVYERWIAEHAAEFYQDRMVLVRPLASLLLADLEPGRDERERQLRRANEQLCSVPRARYSALIAQLVLDGKTQQELAKRVKCRAISP